PTRGSNRRSTATRPRPPAVPHRPYEGQQQYRLRGARPILRFLIAPTRGSNGSWTRPLPPRIRGSSSPLRGAATRPGARDTDRARVPHRPYEGQQQPVRGGECADGEFLIAPTRGSNVRSSAATTAPTCVPHRPYEGQQHSVQAALRRLREFLIAPTRGSNSAAGIRPASPPCSSSPLRGAATPLAFCRRCGASRSS